MSAKILPFNRQKTSSEPFQDRIQTLIIKVGCQLINEAPLITIELSQELSPDEQDELKNEIKAVVVYPKHPDQKHLILPIHWFEAHSRFPNGLPVFPPTSANLQIFRSWIVANVNPVIGIGLVINSTKETLLFKTHNLHPPTKLTLLT